jgi:predicted DNA-binding ribbon-helix-helix protein
MPKRRKGPFGGSLVLRRTIVLNGHRTSVTLENDFWDALKEFAAAQGTLVGQLIATIDKERPTGSTNLSSAIRLFLFNYYRRRP